MKVGTMKFIAVALLLSLTTTAVYAGGQSAPAVATSAATRSYFVRVEYPGRPPVNVALNVFPGVAAKARVGTEFSYVRDCKAPSAAAPVSLIPATTFDGLVLEVNASPVTDEVTFVLTENAVSEIKTVVTSNRCSVQKVDVAADTRSTSGLGIKQGASIEGLALRKFVLTVSRGRTANSIEVSHTSQIASGACNA